MARAVVSVVVVWGLLFVAQAEVFDVTTIYRYDRPGAEPVSFPEIPNFDVQDIVSSWRSIWTRDRTWSHMGKITNGLEVMYLGLEGDYGKLETKLDSSPVKGVCVTLHYYITPRSSATIEIKAVTKEGEVSVGTITAMNDEALSDSWMKQRIIGELNSSLNSLKIVSQKTQRARVQIRNITGCNESEIVNTTINRAGSTEIHARNNALGLPFLCQDDFLYYPSAGVDVETCAGQNCTWEATNFTLVSRQTFPLKLSDYIGISTGSNYFSDSFGFHGTTDFLFVAHENTGILSIYLTDHRESIYDSGMYVIRKYGHKSHKLLKCQYNLSRGQLYDLHITNRYCRVMDSENTEISNDEWHINASYTINVREDNGKVEVTLLNETHRHVLLSAEDDDPISITHFRASLTDMNDMNGKLYVREFRSWMPEHGMGSLVSPPFVPRQNKVCVAVTYTGVLKLNLLQPDEDTEFSSVRRTFLDSTWRTEIFVADITDKPGSPVSVQLVAEDQSLEVALITGCNGQEFEDIHFISTSSNNTYNFEYQAYDVAVFKSIDTDDTNGSSKICINGGIYCPERRGCECPSGFSGDRCETGCGPNKYGSDCGGRCSMSSRRCKGMTLCRPKLGCSCAPGLKGLLCDHPCDDGQYGAGCKQLCGKCNSGTCDSYTGECSSGCEDGFYPPLCQESYKYVSDAPELVSMDFTALQVTFRTDHNHLKGAGLPRFYQIQVKDNNETEDDDTWTELMPHLLPADGVVVSNITGLEPGTLYKVRAVLVDKDANSYQGPDVPVALLYTKCIVPMEVKYNFHHSNITIEEFTVSWNYTRENNTWCKASHYEVELLRNWGWSQQYKGLAESYQFTEMLPGEKYEIRVRVVTAAGAVPVSDVLTVRTLSETPEKVSNLHLETSKPRNLEVKWEKPLFTGGDVHRYQISYKCLKLLACPMDCSHSSGQFEVTTTSAVLHNLLPHAQYTIQVSAMSASWGPTSRLFAVTAMTDPEVSPDPSSTSADAHRTNSSMEVHWEPPQNCSGLNGYLYGYQYELLGHNVSLVGSTDLTMATFHDLSPHTPYTVRVFAVTSGGWNAQYPLLIPVKTRATVPSPVEKLTVYKTGRRMLGIRWAAPRETYGALKSFKISYKLEGHKHVSSVISLTSCIAWPHLYCHTLHSLQPDTVYTVQVQARNNEVNEDGESASIDAVTKESAPLVPSFIRVLSQTETNLTVQWGIPEMLNGQLRSFLVNVEETDSVNSTDCCQYFPIQEVPVRSEQLDYRIQVSSLQPASTYTISIAAKTVSLGPSITITAHTRPPVPSMSNMLTIPDGSENLSSEPKIVIHPSTENVQLIKGYLLLVLPQSTTENTTSEIWDERLAQELAQHTNSSYYIAAEFKGDLQERSELVVGTGREMTTGKWGQVQDPVLEDGATYRFGLVLLQEYCGVFGVGFTKTKTFVKRS